MINELDLYFDAAPRSGAEPVDVGAFTLFVSHAPHGYYARPARTRTNPIVESDLVALEKACAEHNVEMSIEWVHEMHPELAGLASSYGLETHSYTLMVATAGDVTPFEVDGVVLRVIGSDESAVESGRAVADVSFSFGGTNIGRGGPDERDATILKLDLGLIEYLRERDRRGFTVTAVAESADGVISVGSYQPVGDLAEIVGVATLPSVRHRGLAGAVTGLLTMHALDNGVRIVLLSAQDDNVARIYERIGFRRVGFTGEAVRLKQ